MSKLYVEALLFVKPEAMHEVEKEKNVKIKFRCEKDKVVAQIKNEMCEMVVLEN